MSATIVSKTQITCKIPPWPKNGVVDVQIISFDSSIYLEGTPFTIRYCEFKNCQNEYLCKYSLLDESINQVVYTEILSETVKQPLGKVNITSYCQGNNLPYSGNYTVQISIDEGETWLDVDGQILDFEAQNQKLQVLKVFPDTIYIPGETMLEVYLNKVAN